MSFWISVSKKLAFMTSLLEILLTKIKFFDFSK